MGILQRLTKKDAKEKVAPTKKERSVEAAPKKETKETAVSQTSSTISVSTSRILVRPYVSEKAVHGEAVGRYTFLVRRDANKMHVKKAIFDIYGIHPVSVRLMNMEGKRVRFGRSLGKRQDMKKAIVTLPKGKTISIHSGV